MAWRGLEFAYGRPARMNGRAQAGAQGSTREPCGALSLLIPLQRVASVDQVLTPGCDQDPALALGVYGMWWGQRCFDSQGAGPGCPPWLFHQAERSRSTCCSSEPRFPLI